MTKNIKEFTKTELIKELSARGVFTNAKFHENMLKCDDLENISLVGTYGKPTKTNKCRECLKVLPASEFKYYQARVKSCGHLQRSNALCHSCSKEANAERHETLTKDAHKIPPKPKSGDICPMCERSWTGNWHRDHCAKEHKFLRWLCGDCNMARHDQRNKNVEIA